MKNNFIKKVVNTLISKSGLEIGKLGYDYGKEFNNYLCPNPFTYIELMSGGLISTCCYLEKLGNLKNSEFMDIWNSKKAVKIRKSILNERYTLCNKNICAGLQRCHNQKKEWLYPYHLVNKNKLHNQYLQNIINHNISNLSNGPKIISFDNDPSCNLYCPSCRHKRICLTGKEYKEEVRLINKLLIAIKDSVEELWFAGSGDPFASKIYRDFFQNFNPQEYPKVKFRIDTNGQLLTSEVWNTVLSRIHERIKIIAISVDAATKVTYPQIRRGGDFNHLLCNMKFISELKERKKGMQFWIRLIIQKKNYQEMKKFVQLGKKLKVDSVIFSTLDNWGTFTDDEYKDNAIHLPTHPDHQKFIQILKDPIFKDKVVDLGNSTTYYNQLI